MLLWVEGGRACWVVDPGLPPQPDEFAAAIERHNLSERTIVLTHCHADHIAGVAPLRERFGAIPIICPVHEVDMLTSADANLSSAFGMPIAGPAPDRMIGPGDTLTLADLSFLVLDVAGHSPGGLAYYCSTLGVALVGDALFASGIGRYDFPRSSRTRLLRNIRENLLTLPPETWIYSGHGPAATLAEIQATNMTLRMELLA